MRAVVRFRGPILDSDAYRGEIAGVHGPPGWSQTETIGAVGVTQGILSISVWTSVAPTFGALSLREGAG